MTLRLFFSPRRYRTNGPEEEILATGRPFQLKVHDKTLQGWRWGRGPGVVMIHGWNGRGIQFRRFIEPVVNAGYTAIVIDGPAHGASTGRITSYFEFTDTMRLLLSQRRQLEIQGIIAHSFGAAATINALVKEQVAIKTVCIAPVLKLQELIFHAFEQYGIPQQIYSSLIREFENQFGYRLAEDNPHRLIKDLPGNVLMVHDADDRTAPYRNTLQAVRHHDRIGLWSTNGLGHSGILRDLEVIDRCVAFLNNPSAVSNAECVRKETS